MGGSGWGGRRAAAYTAEILARDGHVCVWCHGWADTAEHITPRSLGGDPFDLSNGVAACRSCNSSRNNRPRPSRAPVRPSRAWGRPDE
jgi:5-methylcytosine-specific restriction endonuclease McrA